MIEGYGRHNVEYAARLSRRIDDPATDGDDLLQDAWLRANAAGPRGLDVAARQRYLQVTLTSTALDLHRRLVRRGHHFRVVLGWPQPAAENTEREALTRLALEQVLADAPLEVVARAVGYTGHEIAAVRGVSVMTVSTRVIRWRRRQGSLRRAV